VRRFAAVVSKQPPLLKLIPLEKPRMSRPHLYRVIFPVADIEVAAKFYGRVFEMAGERVSPGRHYFNCGGVILACYDPAADGDDVGRGCFTHRTLWGAGSASSIRARSILARLNKSSRS
jgi:hypothetical protein